MPPLDVVEMVLVKNVYVSFEFDRQHSNFLKLNKIVGNGKKSAFYLASTSQVQLLMAL